MRTAFIRAIHEFYSQRRSADKPGAGPAEKYADYKQQAGLMLQEHGRGLVGDDQEVISHEYLVSVKRYLYKPFLLKGTGHIYLL